MKSASLVIVAKIVKTHGLRGEVVLQSFTDVEGRLENTPAFQVVDGDEEEDGEAVRELEVESRRIINGRHVLKFKGISTLTDAEWLRNKKLAILESELGTLPEGQFFIHDLVGMVVRSCQGEEVGTVRRVIKTGGVDLLEVGEKGHLIPFTDSICVDVDVEKKVITIEPPEGLLQLNAR